MNEADHEMSIETATTTSLTVKPDSEKEKPVVVGGEPLEIMVLSNHSADVDNKAIDNTVVNHDDDKTNDEDDETTVEQPMTLTQRFRYYRSHVNFHRYRFLNIMIISMMLYIYREEDTCQQQLQGWFLLYLANNVYTFMCVCYEDFGRLFSIFNVPFDIFIAVYGSILFYGSGGASECRTIHHGLYIYGIILQSIKLSYLGLAFLIAACAIPFLMLVMYLRQPGVPGASDSDIQKYIKTNRWTVPIPSNESRPTVATNKDCCVCTNEFQLQESVSQLPCSHNFHETCIKRWLKLKRVCPLCRHDITESHSNRS